MLKYLPWIVALGISTGLTTNAARADDAYVCDGGRLVYARPETLEKLKQTDPCVALFYNNNKPVAATSPVPAQLAPAVSPVTPAAPSMTAKNKTPAAKSAPLKNSRDAAIAPTPPKSEQAKPALAKPVEAAPGTDFRNVRVINAPAGPEFFHHDR